MGITATAIADVQLRVSPTQPGETLQAAITQVENLRLDPGQAHKPVTITLATGTYYLTKPLRLPADIGPITFTSPPNQTAELSGGMEITDWKPVTFNGKACWFADIPAVRVLQLNFRQLWVNGKRATRARYPAHGYLASVNPPQKDVLWNQGQNSFGYKPGDLPDQLPQDAEAIIMDRWVEARLPGLTLDADKKIVRSVRSTQYQLEDGDPYFLEGASQWLTEPGEWYLDKDAGKLYYLPRATEQLTTINVVAPLLDHLLEMRGASNVTFRGVGFAHTEWNLPEATASDTPSVGGFGQAAIGVPAAVRIEGATHCRFEKCVFEHLGDYALQLSRGCQGNFVDHCTFTDLGAGAIKIGDEDQAQSVADQTFGNIVSDCQIADGGHLFPSAVGIWIGQSYNNRIQHNEISDLFYTAISMGWTWGYGTTLCKGNHVEQNVIHHIGKKSNGDGPILSDMGGIYTLGIQPGTIIAGNVLHDIAGRTYGGWGIYLDEGSSNLLVEKNLVYRTTHGGFHQHYGQHNMVRNNLFAFSRDVQIARTTIEPTESFTFTRNIVAWNTGVFTRTTPEHMQFDGNLYHCTTTGELSFGSLTWPQWQAAGMDPHSIMTDPKFKDIQRDDFTPNPAACARIGFETLDTASAGPR